MTDRELRLLGYPEAAEGPIEAVKTTADPGLRGLARMLLANRDLMKGCLEHEFRAVTELDRGPGELDRPFQCVRCGGRVYKSYVEQYAAEKPQRDEWRRFKAQEDPPCVSPSPT